MQINQILELNDNITKWIKKKDPTMCCWKETYFTSLGIHGLIEKVGHHVQIETKNASATIPKSCKIDF